MWQNVNLVLPVCILPKTISFTTSCIRITSWEVWFQGNLFLLSSQLSFQWHSLRRSSDSVSARPCAILTGQTQNTLWYLPLNITALSGISLMETGCWDCNDSINGLRAHCRFVLILVITIFVNTLLLCRRRLQSWNGRLHLCCAYVS